MKRDPVRATVLASKIIPNVSPDMAKELNLEPGNEISGPDYGGQ